MPSEPLPWDRKDFYKERKHERTQSLPQQPLTGRWRDSSSMSPYQHGSFREFTRWGSADFRRPPGHGRQGSWHLFAEGNGGHAFVPSRSGNRILDDEIFRLSDSRVDVKYGRNSRENNRGSYSQRDWRGHSWESCNGSPSTPGRTRINNERRSVDDMSSYHSHAHSDFVNTLDQLQKGQNDNKGNVVNELGTGQRCQRENSAGSIDWKPLKWSRSGSLSSRGSGFSHSSSSKSLGVDSGEGKVELQLKNLTPLQSPSGDAAACVATALSSDETLSRKKPRLAWGEGLAKYEKKKVEGPGTSTDRGGATMFVCNTEFNNSMSSNLADKSPRVFGFPDCASPATPSSVACSSSPGAEEKSFGKAANIDNDINNLCGSPSIGSKNHLDGPSFNLEKLDIDSIINMGSSLINLLQPDDPGTVDSSFVLSTAINKLLLLKGDALKALEMTESEIDSLENELKSLKGDSRSGCPFPATSSSLPVEEHGKACGEQEAPSCMIPRPTPLKIDTCADVLVENLRICNGVPEEVNGDIDSPGTATSEFVEPLSSEKAVSLSDIVKFHECSGDLDSVQLTTMDEVILATGSGNGGTATAISVEGSLLKKIDNDAPVPESSSSDAGREDVMYGIILAANKELAFAASEVFNKLLPKDFYGVEISEIANVACTQSDTAIREKIAMRKQYLRFKERVLTLKFKAFQNAWKEDIYSLLMRKHRAKSQKKFELTLRSTHGGYQKHRSSIRSRVPSPAGNLVQEPSAEMINFASKLIPDSYGRIHKNALKMPALILDEREKKVSRFISTNGLVEDPFAIEKERALINPWTSEEKEIFIDKLASFGKDFRKIASFLDHKTTADCIEFYYKNHKSECFEKTKNKNDLRKQGKSAVNTYLLTSGKNRSSENAASLDVLGAASVIAAHAESSVQSRHKSSGRIFLGGRFDSKTSRIDDCISIRSSNLDIIGSDEDTVAADVLAGICGSISSEAMGSCITSSAGPGVNYHHDWKCHKIDSVVKRYSTSDVLQNVDEDTCSDESCGEMDSAHWTDEEKSIFIQAVSSCGKDFEMISRYVGTRSRDQCKVFFSKARKCLGLDLIRPRTRNMGTPMSDDANGGGNDKEDACVQESSVMSGDKLGSNVEGDLPPTIVSSNVAESDPTREASLQTDLIISEGNGGNLVDCKNSEAVEVIFSDVDKTGHISEGGADGMDVDSNQAESLLVQNSAAFANLNALRNHIEQGVSLAVPASHGGTVDPHLKSLNALVDPKSDAAWSTEGFGNNSEARRTLLSKNGIDEHDAKCSSETDSQLLRRSDSNKSGDESIDKNFVTKGLHQVPLDLGSARKPPMLSLSDESSFAKISALHDSDTSQCDNNNICNQDRLSSTLAYSETEEKHAGKAVSGHESEQFSGNPLADLAEMQISTSKEINVDVGRSQLPDVKRFSTLERGVTGSFSAQSYLHKCNGTKPAAELPQLVQKLEQANSRQKSHFRSLSDTKKPGRNGNVKLFGQILNSSSQDGEKVAHLSKQSAKYSDSSSTGCKNVDGNGSFTKFDRNIMFAPENVPKRSYGFWDGNRIQTGLSSLPDSAILVAKYPAAFVNYPSPSSQMEQQASHTVVRNTDRNSNSVSVFTPRETSSNGAVMDRQPYRIHDRTKVAPLTTDVKQPQGLISELQRRNLHHHGRGKVGMSVGSNLSDPVAVLRMQFAKTESYSGGSRTREEESCRGTGDMDICR